MHRSRLQAIGIDCQNTDLVAAAKFWAAVLGRKAASALDAEDPRYIAVGDGKEPLITFCQNVEHPSGVHIAIETDDVEAEVARLEKFGAKRLKQIKSWWVLEAPTGHRFCIVRTKREMPADSNVWE